MLPNLFNRLFPTFCVFTSSFAILAYALVFTRQTSMQRQWSHAHIPESADLSRAAGDRLSRDGIVSEGLRAFRRLRPFNFETTRFSQCQLVLRPFTVSYTRRILARAGPHMQFVRRTSTVRAQSLCTSPNPNASWPQVVRANGQLYTTPVYTRA